MTSPCRAAGNGRKLQATASRATCAATDMASDAAFVPQARSRSMSRTRAAPWRQRAELEILRSW